MKKITLTILIAILTTVAIVNGVNAQSASSNAAQGVQVSPTRIEHSTDRGQSFNIKVTATNVTASDLTYTTSIQDFAAVDESGSPKVSINTDLPDTVSVRNWIQDFPESFTLAARESRDITATVNIPENAEPGGHYGSIVFSGSEPSVDSNGVGVSASTGVLLLFRVGSDSEIIEQADIEEFTTASGETRNWFFEESPVNFIARINNSGNVHIKPKGNITIKNMFGNVDGTIEFNTEDSNVLPNTIRKFTYEFKHDWMFGMYTADIELGYGTTGGAMVRTISFWVVPYKLILATIFVLATLLFITRKMLRAYNKRIIERARKHDAPKGR